MFGNEAESSSSNEKFENWDKNSLTVVNVDLETDPRLGRILGFTTILISSIQEYLDEEGAERFYCQDHKLVKSKKILVSVNGRFQYNDDPTPPVISWMQKRCEVWKHKSEDNQSGVLRVVGHIRVPEYYCEKVWKDANSIRHLLDTWKEIHEVLETIELKNVTLSFQVFTEDSFPPEQEHLLLDGLAGMGCLGVQVHRQTPLLPCVQSMATSDIFIPASSFLSAFASFFQTSLIVLPNEATRHDKYFAPHLKHSSTTPFIPDGVEREGEATVSGCPIVRVEDKEKLKETIVRVVQRRANNNSNILPKNNKVNTTQEPDETITAGTKDSEIVKGLQKSSALRK